MMKIAKYKVDDIYTEDLEQIMLDDIYWRQPNY